MAVYLNRQEIASYQGQPKNVPNTKPLASSKDKKKPETVTVRQDAKKVEKTKPISAMHKVETVTTTPGTNAVIPADHISSSENIPGTEAEGNGFVIESKIKDKLLGMQIRPTKLSKAEFEKLKESCASDSAKNSLIKDMSYEQYETESQEFAADLKAGLASGHTISFKEMVLFGGNHYTREAWDAVAGSKQDGVVDEDDQLDLSDLDKNFELVANYETMHGPNSYTGQTKFVVVDINEINEKAQLDGKSLSERPAAASIKKIVDYLKKNNVEVSLGNVSDKWKLVLLYLTFARTLGDAAVKDSNLQFDYVNTKLADMLGGKAMESKPAKAETKTPSKAASLTEADEVAEENDLEEKVAKPDTETSGIKNIKQAHVQMEKILNALNDKSFGGEPEKVSKIQAELDKLSDFAKNGSNGKLPSIIGGKPGADGKPRRASINQFIEYIESQLELYKPIDDSQKEQEPSVEENKSADKKSDHEKPTAAEKVAGDHFVKILNMFNPKVFKGTDKEIAAIKNELVKLKEVVQTNSLTQIKVTQNKKTQALNIGEQINAIEAVLLKIESEIKSKGKKQSEKDAVGNEAVTKPEVISEKAKPSKIDNPVAARAQTELIRDLMFGNGFQGGFKGLPEQINKVKSEINKLKDYAKIGTNGQLRSAVLLQDSKGNPNNDTTVNEFLRFCDQNLEKFNVVKKQEVKTSDKKPAPKEGFTPRKNQQPKTATVPAKTTNVIKKDNGTGKAPEKKSEEFKFID